MGRVTFTLAVQASVDIVAEGARKRDPATTAPQLDAGGRRAVIADLVVPPGTLDEGKVQAAVLEEPSVLLKHFKVRIVG